MPRFAVYSDLHYEYGSQFEPPSALRGKVDGVILAGDICSGPATVTYARHISRLLDAPAILIAGNHEFYDQVMEPFLDDLRSKSDDEVHFLEGDPLEIAGARILGTTLWTDFALNEHMHLRAIHDMHKLMNDYRWIKRVSSTKGTRKIDTRRILAKHIDRRNWLSQELAKPFAGPTIVVTHHAPSRRSLEGHDTSRLVAAAYASNLDHFIETRKIDVWIHGHIHESRDYMIGDTRIVSNPYGYESNTINPNFKPDFVIEV